MLGTVVANIGFVLIEWGYRLAGDTKAEARDSLRRVVEQGFGRLENGSGR
jgi:hypothetical protein